MITPEHLLIEEGPERGREIAVPAAGLRIGRSSRNDLSLADPALSRFQCRFFFKPGEGFWISDLGSANGTLVNGVEVTEQRLRVKDEILIGETRLRVISDREPDGVVPVTEPAAGRHGVPIATMRRWAGLGLVVALGLVALYIWDARRSSPVHPAEPAPHAELSAVARPDLEVSYERVDGSLSNLFRYGLELRGHKLGVQVDDLAGRQHLRREKRVEPAQVKELADALVASGFLDLQAEYLGPATGIHQTADMTITVGARTARTRVVNRDDPEAFAEACAIVEEFSGKALGLDGLVPVHQRMTARQQGAIPAPKTRVTPAGAEVTLEPGTGLLLVKSVPDGAAIWVEGVQRGRAPLLLTDLPLGRHRVEARMEGYASGIAAIEIPDRTPREVMVELVLTSATLALDSMPSGATVRVNGAVRGRTPCRIERVPAGDREVSLALEDFAVETRVIRINPGEDQSLSVTLTPLQARVQIVSEPKGARIFVDDHLRGVAPLTLDDVTAGPHMIRAELDGYEPLSLDVHLKGMENPVQTLTLTRSTGLLEVLTSPTGAVVAVDGTPLGAGEGVGTSQVSRLTVELPVGEHRLNMVLNGYIGVERRVRITRGQTVTVKEALKRDFVPTVSIKLMTGEQLTGRLNRKLADGALEIEVRSGIFRTLNAADVVSMDPLGPPANP